MTRDALRVVGDETTPIPEAEPKAKGGGKPPIRTAKALRDAAREHSREALEALARIAGGTESPASRIAAATAILDRAFGKARAEPEPELEKRRPTPIHRLETVIIDPKAPDPERR